MSQTQLRVAPQLSYATLAANSCRLVQNRCHIWGVCVWKQTTKIAAIGWLNLLFQVGSGSNCSGCTFGFALSRSAGGKWWRDNNGDKNIYFSGSLSTIVTWVLSGTCPLLALAPPFSSLVLSPPPSQCLPGLKREGWGDAAEEYPSTEAETSTRSLPQKTGNYNGD